MKVGDLVRKKGGGRRKRAGLLICLGHGIATVNWFSYGTYMTPAHTLEVVNEAR